MWHYYSGGNCINTILRSHMATLVSRVKKEKRERENGICTMEEVTISKYVVTANEDAKWYRSLENILTFSKVVIYRDLLLNFTASYLLIASIITITW